MEHNERSVDGSPIFDALDIDLVVKVLANTLFSPFFIFFIPIFYIFQGVRYTDSVVVISSSYLVAISLFWLIKWSSRLYRNQGNIFFGTAPLDWGEQIVLITGGASGIGELLANTLAVRNVTVVVLDIEPIETENFNIAYYKCDVSKWEEVELVAKKITEEIGDPTIIVNNAGVVQGKLILDLTSSDVHQTFGANILSHFWIIKAFLPAMLKRKSGHIITMSSVLGMIGVAQMSDYNASKAAAMSLHESLRRELDKRYCCPSIRTTLLCPGHVLTPMFETTTLPTNPLLKFLIPSIQPVTVVKKIITALDEQHSQIILTPFYTNFVPFLGHLPSFLRDLVQAIVGADYSMKSFVKKTGKREEEGKAIS